MCNSGETDVSHPVSEYFVQRVENRIPSRLPELNSATVVKQITPRFRRAKFAQYLLVLEAGGGTAGPVATGYENFLYVTGGEVEVRANNVDYRLGCGDGVYLSDTTNWELATRGDAPAEMLWLKRRYESVEGVPEPDAARVTLSADRERRASKFPGLTVQDLMPVGDMAYDFTMTILGFEPGADFPGQEVHEEEHAHVQLSGVGISSLGPIAQETLRRGDFLYMAPFCPHGYASAPDSPSEFLLYKDANRSGF